MNHKIVLSLKIVNFGFICNLSYWKLWGLVLLLKGGEYGSWFERKGLKVQQLWES